MAGRQAGEEGEVSVLGLDVQAGRLAAPSSAVAVLQECQQRLPPARSSGGTQAAPHPAAAPHRM
jgi:hypothetical protein